MSYQYKYDKYKKKNYRSDELKLLNAEWGKLFTNPLTANKYKFLRCILAWSSSQFSTVHPPGSPWEKKKCCYAVRCAGPCLTETGRINSWPLNLDVLSETLLSKMLGFTAHAMVSTCFVRILQPSQTNMSKLRKSQERGRTFSSSRVKPRPARTLVWYLTVGHLTCGLRGPATGRGATRRALAWRAFRLNKTEQRFS